MNFFCLNCILIFCIVLLLRNSDAFPRENNSRKENVHVVVIGGGVAGVTAADNLHKAGFTVTLLEAMDRVGGRTWTFKMENGMYTELGAEWVHGQYNNSVYDLMNPLGVFQEKKPREFGNTFGLQTGELLNGTLNELISEFKEYIWNDPDDWFSEYIQNKSLSSTGEWAQFVLPKFNEKFHLNDDAVILQAIFDWAHRVTNAEDCSDNWFQSSKREFGEQYIALDGFENVPWKPPYSFHTLIQYILTDQINEDGNYELPEWIHLNKEVVNIAYDESLHMVTVTDSNGMQYEADHVIFTPSLGILKANHKTLFTPQLSDKKQLAIESLGFGCVTKYAMEFEEAWWPTNYEGLFPIWNDHDYSNEYFNYWRDGITREELEQEIDGIPLWGRAILNFFTVDSDSAPNVLRSWITGWPSRFMDEMDPTYIQNIVMKVLHKFLDKTFDITEPIRTYQSKWWSNPFIRGSYSFRTVKSEELDVWARNISTPILNLDTGKPLVCFAGEATHPIYFSTVHGAYDTGLREFQRIQKFYA